MKYTILFSVLVITLSSTAQECSKELLRNKPGTWKIGPQGTIANVKAGDLLKEKAVITNIHKMISANYQPTGCQVEYSTVYGKYPDPGQAWIADPFHYIMYIKRYLCDQQSADKSKYYVDISTTTTVNITANVIYSLNNLYAADMGDDFRGYLKLKERPVKKNGYYFMGEEIVGDYGTPSEIKEYRWLITYNDTLPFYYLSRKEYLLIQKKRLEKAIKEIPAEKEYYDKFLKNVNDYLTHSEADLSKPAVGMWNDEERFEKFVEEGTLGSFIAIKPNLDYYHKKLSNSSPQFFTVVYQIAKGYPVFQDNISNIQKAVNFDALKNMLGK